MARIYEEKITIKISEMIRDDQSQSDAIFDTDTVEQLIAILQELVGKNRLIELITE
jgi:hypothetical protein